MSGFGGPADAILAALAAPIDAAHPAGHDVGGDDDYRRIAEARRDENGGLPRGVWVRDVKHADWALVERLCIATLTRRSKDLRVASWLSEAWVHRHGFAGLAAAIALIDRLCSDFWDGLFPTIDDAAGGDGAGARIAAIEWLNDRLPVVLRLVPVVTGGQPEVSFTWSDYLGALRLDAVRLRDAAAAQKAEAGGAVTLAAIEACRDATDAETLTRFDRELTTALAALATLDATLDERCGKEAPGLGRIREVATDIAGFVRGALATRQEVLAPSPLFPPPPPPPPPSRSATPVPVAGAPAGLSRDTAYRQLGTIAAFLRETEPHSPVPAVLDQLAGWGRLSLVDIDAALQDTGSNMSLLLQLLGFIASNAEPNPP